MMKTTVLLSLFSRVRRAVAQSFGALVVSALLSAIPSAAHARYSEVSAELNKASMVGEARYRVLSMTLFDAQLWANKTPFSWEQPFALSLTYKRAIKSESLVSRSVRGMNARAKVGSKEELTALLRPCLSDVRAGDRFTAVSVDPTRARFFLNGRQTCDISWPGFRRAFFSIWLDASGNDRAFSKRLTGASDAEQTPK